MKKMKKMIKILENSSVQKYETATQRLKPLEKVQVFFFFFLFGQPSSPRKIRPIE
jgi:hypothetical protein